MRALGQKFMRLLRDESGATAIEYGLIAGLIGVVMGLAGTASSPNRDELPPSPRSGC
jgi:hypothetical protein